MKTSFVILTIHPEHAKRIYDGDKKVELRKTFTKSARVVFLYETQPVSAITGAIVVRDSFRDTSSSIAEVASELGVPQSRTLEYLRGRSQGWAILIETAIKFNTPTKLSDLKALNHYFSPPQSFCYLEPFDAVSQTLTAQLLEEAKQLVKITKAKKKNHPLIGEMIQTEVSKSYEDINNDFIEQTFSDNPIRNFSTKKKHILEVSLSGHIIGFSVVTEKVHGSWKTGPTILSKEFRGIGFAQLTRLKIEEFCRRRGALSIYCTCADNNPTVVSYILNSGMTLQARLRAHLSRDRDELVFSKKIIKPRSHPSEAASPAGNKDTKTKNKKKIETLVVGKKNDEQITITSFFCTLMNEWYFPSSPEIEAAILDSLRDDGNGFNYSQKTRSIIVSRDIKSKENLGACLVTPKRSQMAKLNLVSTSDCEQIAVELLQRALLNHGFRRFYITIPVTKTNTISSLNKLGFNFEGIIASPFIRDVDHACFGKVAF